MPTKTVSIKVNHAEHNIVPGLTTGLDIAKAGQIPDTMQLLFKVSEIDIPVQEADCILIRGGEEFSIVEKSSQIDDNPPLKHSISFQFSTRQAPIENAILYAKVMGSELRALAGGNTIDLWADLDGVADSLIEDTHRLILQSQDRFFTAPHDEGDRFYEVTVIFDGAPSQRRFPALMTVQEAIRRCLPPKDKPLVNEFEMVDGDIGTQPLNQSFTLKAAGVRSEHVLSITKKNGGGG